MFDTEITFIDGVSVTIHADHPLTDKEKAVLVQMTSGQFYARARLEVPKEPPLFIHQDEWPFYLEGSHPQHGRRVIDEQGPWPPRPVDPVVARGVKDRITRAEEKRERRKRRNLKHA